MFIQGPCQSCRVGGCPVDMGLLISAVLVMLRHQAGRTWRGPDSWLGVCVAPGARARWVCKEQPPHLPEAPPCFPVLLPSQPSAHTTGFGKQQAALLFFPSELSARFFNFLF